MTNFLPAGTVLPYAADDTSKLSGWVACNGSALNTGDYPDLFEIIGYSNGGSGTVFYLPDLRGRFLRGTLPDQLPGVTTAFTTYNPFTLSLQYIPSDYHLTDFGAIGPLSHSMVKWNSGSNLFNISGGDAETRPVNVYMNYIIKLTNATTIPAGSLIPYAGDDSSTASDNDTYLFCDGNNYRSNSFPDLSKAIGTRFQSSSRAGYFSVPALDGQFIRGLDIGGVDPDISSRLAAPDGTKGSAVGTVQRYATCGKGFTVAIDHYPPGSSDDVYPTEGHDNLYDSNSTSSLTFGGTTAKESRPNNVSVSYYIKSKSTPDSLDFPIGGIIAVPGLGTSTPDKSVWAICDGSSITASSNPALFNTLKNAWGGTTDSSSFNLPNLQGQFLRATDNHDASAQDSFGDPDRFLRSFSNPGGVTVGTGSKQTFATALPQNPFTISGMSYPTNDHENAATAIGRETSEYNSNWTTFTITGGDKETAPTSVLVIFYVKIV